MRVDRRQRSKARRTSVRLASLALALALAPSFAAPAQAQRSLAMRLDCQTAQPNTRANRERAEQWVRDKLKAFLPSPEEALRMLKVGGEAEQAKLAFFSISTTCEQYRAGRISREAADLVLSGDEQRIADFLHELDNELKVMASSAQVADLDKMRALLTTTGEIARQAALLGEDALAESARKQMVDTLIRFSASFVDRTCWDQVFDDALPFNFQRQNELMGTGIDVRPCAQRRFRAVVAPLTFESCTVRGAGDWRVRWDMLAPGASGGTGSGELDVAGTEAKGDYRVDWGANGAEYRASGDLKLTRRDNGPGRKATYTLAGEMDIRITKGAEMVRMMAQLMNQKVGGKYRFSVEPDVSDKPCRSLDGSHPMQ